MNKSILLISSLVLLLAVVSNAQILNQEINPVLIKSGLSSEKEFQLNNTTSVADYISKKQLEKYNYTDVGKALSTVNGVYVYEEDGFGLRPNISIRGTGGARSSKINLMEDGIPISPAPYTASSAYYFPTLSRMQGIEVLKGNSQIQYGPHTTGGAINMITTAIPDSLALSLNLGYGSFNTTNILANIGTSTKYYGLLAEYSNNSSNGFKTIQGHENLNTGFDKNEIMLKGRVHSDISKSQYHLFELKFHYYDETSNETYLGLARDDFDSAPLMRYAASMNDLMKAHHYLYSLKYKFKLSKSLNWTTDAYYNKFKRNWYKLNDLTIDDTNVSISNILEDRATYSEYYNVLNGQTTQTGDYLKNRANNRLYESKGIQSKLTFDYSLGKVNNRTEIGTRIHYDDEDRMQWEDQLGMKDNSLYYISRGRKGTQSNMVTSSVAWSNYIYQTFKLDRLSLTGGLRHELINGEVLDYGKADTLRMGSNMKTKENSYGILIPGIGFNYKILNKMIAFGGIHRGFSPASVASNVEAESSTNYELGLKFKNNRFNIQLVSFLNDYQNMLGSNQNAIGGGGTLEQYNAGEVTVKGIELNASKIFLLHNNKMAIPMKFGYTFTDARFNNSFQSKNELWNDVQDNDILPYIARHQLFFDLGYTYGKWNVNFINRMRSEMLIEASANFDNDNTVIPTTIVSDMSLKYEYSSAISIGINALNIFNIQNPVSNIPAGYRTMMPRAINLNIQLKY